jgi:hypothetical protein
MGSVVLTTICEDKKAVDIGGLPGGIYTVRVSIGRTVAYRKLVKRD